MGGGKVGSRVGIRLPKWRVGQHRSEGHQHRCQTTDGPCRALGAACRTGGCPSRAADLRGTAVVSENVDSGGSIDSILDKPPPPLRAIVSKYIYLVKNVWPITLVPKYIRGRRNTKKNIVAKTMSAKKNCRRKKIMTLFMDDYLYALAGSTPTTPWPASARPVVFSLQSMRTAERGTTSLRNIHEMSHFHVNQACHQICVFIIHDWRLLPRIAGLDSFFDTAKWRRNTRWLSHQNNTGDKFGWVEDLFFSSNAQEAILVCFNCWNWKILIILIFLIKNESKSDQTKKLIKLSCWTHFGRISNCFVAKKPHF